MATRDEYRIALLNAFNNSTPATRDELATELSHQRDMDKLFMTVEIGTLIAVGFFALAALVIAIVLLIAGKYISGTITIVGDLVTLSGIALGRSYFINKSGRAPKADDSDR